MTVRIAVLLLAGVLLVASCAGPVGSERLSAKELRSPPPAEDAGRRADLPPCPRSADVPPVDAGLPDLTLPCLGPGPAVTLSGLRGKPTVVNVWASWCPPCAREMPILDEARRRLGDRARFIGVDLLDTREAGSAAAVAFGMGFPSLFDPDGRSRAALKVPGPPVTLLVRSDGTVAYRQLGEIKTQAQLRGLLAEHLGLRW